MSGEQVYQFPTDERESLCRVLAIYGGGADAIPFAESLLDIPDLFDLVHFRSEFGGLRVTPDGMVIVPNDEHAGCAEWLDQNLPPGAATWIDLEAVMFFSMAAQQRFEAAFATVVGQPPICRPLSDWPEIFTADGERL